MRAKTGKQWIHHYYSKEQERRNRVIQKLLAKYQPVKPMEGALGVRIDVYFKVPKSYSKKKRELCLTDKILPTKTPDLDNIRKWLYDQLVKARYIKDDSQICWEEGTKRFSATPHIRVEIWRCGDAL